MPIVDTDLLWKLSVNTSPGNANAQGDPDASLGGYMATTVVDQGTPANNLFADVSGADNAASAVHYRGTFWHNNHATLALQAPSIWLSSEQAGGTDVAIALAGEGVVPEDQAGTPQMEVVADEDTAPSGESFTSPSTKGAGLTPGDIDAGECVGLWIRRTAADTAAVNNDGFDVTIEGDTAA